MIKTPDGEYINENNIYSIVQENDDTCAVYFMQERNSPYQYAVKMNCETYMKKMGIEVKEMKK